MLQHCVWAASDCVTNKGAAKLPGTGGYEKMDVNAEGMSSAFKNHLEPIDDSLSENK